MSIRSRNVVRVGLIALASAALLSPGCDPPPPEGQKKGESAIEISGKTADGKSVKLSDYKGKVVLVNFWATWCPPCRQLIPHERQMVEGKYRGKPFAILGIAIDQPEDLAAFLKANPLPWTNIADGKPGPIAQEWYVESIPGALVVDETGVIRGRWINDFDPDEVWEAVEKAVRAVESKSTAP